MFFEEEETFPWLKIVVNQTVKSVVRKSVLNAPVVIVAVIAVPALTRETATARNSQVLAVERP